MTTKERILKTALKLFNDYGLSKVTLRTIANEMGISQGNLNYHFKKREFIIEALYFQLVQNIDNGMAKNKATEVGLRILFNSSTLIMKNFYEYRFFMLDFVQIIRENKQIKKHYVALTILRETQFKNLFDLMTASNIMREAILPNEYQFLYKRFQILGDFWISSAMVSHKKITKKIMEDYAIILHQAIYPYLTKKGQESYLEILKLKA